MPLFPISEYWSFYLAFTAFVALMLALDLGVFHRKHSEVSAREAAVWTAVWVSLALLFNAGLYVYSRGIHGEEAAQRLGLEFLTGFVIEKTLAIDNIFVFAMVFSYFKIPGAFQHRILFYGILGALLFRGLFIALSSYLMAYHFVVIGFGILLMLTGVKLLFSAQVDSDPGSSWIARGLQRLFPLTQHNPGGKFFVRQNGVLYATPLFLALMFIEVSDLIFAVDSVPAIFAVTSEPFLVFTSNIFAILGLRSMYFLIGGMLERFSLIRYGLAAVLVFVGLKMAYLNTAFDGKFPITWSLLIIALLIGGSMLASLLRGPAVKPAPPAPHLR